MMRKTKRDGCPLRDRQYRWFVDPHHLNDHASTPNMKLTIGGDDAEFGGSGNGWSERPKSGTSRSLVNERLVVFAVTR